MGRKMILEIGCGEQKVIDGSIGVDFRRTNVVDIIADARKLPFKDSCFDQVFSSHTIEHFSHREVKEVLHEWVRVLRLGGELELRCPDLQARALIFFLRPSWKNVQNIYGGQDYCGNYHKCGFSYGLLKELLEQAGIKRVRRILRRRGYLGVPFLPDCLHIKGLKTNK